MPQFTKKPVTIEAVAFCHFSNGNPVFASPPNPDWLLQAVGKARGLEGSIWWERRDPAPTSHDPLAQRGAELVLLIGTLEGEHIASPGDWIIRGVKGELYPCKPAIFDMSYDVAAAPVDYGVMLAGDMLAAVGTDAMKWADAFADTACFDNPLGRSLRAFPHETKSNERAVLHGTMLGWFANAIEAGRSAGEQAIRRKAYPLFSEAVICEPIVGETHLTIRYQSTQDAHAALAALMALAREVGIVGDAVSTEGEAREQLADGFAADFDQAIREAEATPEMQAVFARGAAGASSPVAGDEVDELVGWRDGIRVVPDERMAARIALEFIVENRVGCGEDTVEDRVYENAPRLVERLADAVGYYHDPKEA